MDHPVNRDNQAYVDEINKRVKEEFRLEYLGGPEMVSTFDQAEAFWTGMINVDLFVPFAGYKAIGYEIKEYS